MGWFKLSFFYTFLSTLVATSFAANCYSPDDHAGDTIVIQCKDDSWCCGATNGTCCDRGDGKWIVNGRITDTNPKLQTSTTSSSFTSSSISSASTSTITPAGESSNQNSLPSPDPQPSSGSNNAGAIAGGVVGGVAVLAILAAAIWFFRRRARNDREQQQQKQQESPPPEQPPPMAPSTIPQPNTISIGGLHEAFAPTNEKDPAHLDSRERFEIGYQDKDKNNRQELAA
ncbi:MAG: hypothetical protein L6R41_006509 [Letrouitia leprolyta]|nr:MAG: hypothetical protein L6R41_006509 [Letrouitia leprolyta]